MTKKDPGMNPADELELPDQARYRCGRRARLARGTKAGEKKKPSLEDGSPRPPRRHVAKLTAFKRWLSSGRIPHAAAVGIKFLAASNGCRVPEPVQTNRGAIPALHNFMREAVRLKWVIRNGEKAVCSTNLRPSNWSLASWPTCFLANFQLGVGGRR